MFTLFLHRNCQKCKNTVTQLVFYEEENEELRIISYWKNCLVCNADLTAPTIEEIQNNPYFIKP
jgi:hypothetical protein